MKILKKRIEHKNQDGVVVVSLEKEDDMYHLYNIINNGDRITSSTLRAVIHESTSGSTTKQRMKITLKISVEYIIFDTDSCSLHIKGKCCEENDYVKIGQYHTIDIELNQTFTVEKECWDLVHLKMLDDACDSTNTAEIAAVIMQDGLANICIVGNTMTSVKCKVEKHLPKKRQSNEIYMRARNKFFEEVYLAVTRHVNFDHIKVLIIASPGYVKDDFVTFMGAKSTKQNDNYYSTNKSKIIKLHSSSGYKKSLDEILGSDKIGIQLVNFKAVDEAKALKRFYDMLGTQENWVCYGFSQVLLADEYLLIHELLITDTLFKSSDIVTRQKYIKLIEEVKSHGGVIHVFSSMHTSGEQLNLLTGVAAILRAPLCVDDMLEIVTEANGSNIGNKMIKQKKILRDDAGGIGDYTSGGESDFSDDDSDYSIEDEQARIFSRILIGIEL